MRLGPGSRATLAGSVALAAPTLNKLPALWKAASNEELQGKSECVFSHSIFVCIGLLEGKVEGRGGWQELYCLSP